MFKYGFQLVTVELLTISAIYLVRLIIDYLNSREEPIPNYNIWLFVGFCLLRWFAILIRNYYDLHVYNFFRFVQTAI